MAFPSIDIRPQTGPVDESDAQHVTVYDVERGGHYPINEKDPSGE